MLPSQISGGKSHVANSFGFVRAQVVAPSLGAEMGVAECRALCSTSGACGGATVIHRTSPWTGELGNKMLPKSFLSQETRGENLEIHWDALMMQCSLGGGKHCVFGGSSDAQCWHECNLSCGVSYWLLLPLAITMADLELIWMSDWILCVFLEGQMCWLRLAGY